MKKIKVIDPALFEKRISKSQASKLMGGSDDPAVTDLATTNRNCTTDLDIWREKKNEDECQPAVEG